MRIFVDVRHQIPCHRRLPLFCQLVQRVGVETHLWSLVILIMESSIRKPDASGDSAANQDQKPEMVRLVIFKVFVLFIYKNCKYNLQFLLHGV